MLGMKKRANEFEKGGGNMEIQRVDGRKGANGIKQDALHYTNLRYDALLLYSIMHSHALHTRSVRKGIKTEKLLGCLKITKNGLVGKEGKLCHDFRWYFLNLGTL